MTSLEKLQEKIEQWRVNHEALKSENAELKVELAKTTAAQDEKDFAIESLKCELQDKDDEIEKIITQVEALLS